jgi:hypothetical protein
MFLDLRFFEMSKKGINMSRRIEKFFLEMQYSKEHIFKDQLGYDYVYRRNNNRIQRIRKF